MDISQLIAKKRNYSRTVTIRRRLFCQFVCFVIHQKLGMSHIKRF